ncbi:MAG: helix-turn-helix domain-containing protein [Candidatus Marinimicrobia bacterium]|nr:helix-turn-helix domain-containing protein [Candidatus Neomarinimicrobiota bacterium]
MDEFYKELKALRERQSIDLAEIQNRTKINIKFLEAFEEGNFEVLPKAYVRLFLRAYVIEIGGDPEEALTQFEHFLSRAEGEPVREKSKSKPVITMAAEQTGAPSSGKTFSISQYRSNLVKGGVLLIIWVFAIFIIQKSISQKQESSPETIPAAAYLANDVDIITEVALLSDFVAASTDEAVLNIEPPFSLKIITIDATGFQVKQDTLASEAIAIPAGDIRTYTFDQELDLLFNHSRGLNVYLNGDAIRKIQSQNDPVRVRVTADPLNITVIHYTPIQ